jgi:hypothetical protein|tara:strand:+ start:386 stop:1234 length:849 start_codon:yes stop_codon:yes gene_type:complete
MKIMNLKIIGIAVAMLCFASANSQIKTPQPSPTAEIKQAIGLTKVELSYSRPSVKGRAIFGDLVAYGKLWRTGANSATTIKTEGEIMLAGKSLKKGKYSVFTIPGESEWTIIINSDPTASTNKYAEDKDVMRFKVTSTKTASKVESFTMLFSNLTGNSADWQIIWENTMVTIPVKTDVDKEVMATIESVINGPSSRDLYMAAKYYYNNDKDNAKALTWINKAVALDGDDQKFWVVHWQAKITAKSGNKKAAITAAEKSKVLAQKAEYDEYVKKNDDLIKSLK